MEQISILGNDQKENLKKVLDYVEKYNKQDEDMQVAQACADLEELLETKVFCTSCGDKIFPQDTSEDTCNNCA